MDAMANGSGLHTMADSSRDVRTYTAQCFSEYEGRTDLRAAAPQLVRAGKAGGLPFNSLTTDLFTGCLRAREICYGNCFAARAAFLAGINFGQRVPNLLDHDVLAADLEALPRAQRFLRSGWNSDPSWDWRRALTLAEWVRESGRLTIFVTKSFTRLDTGILNSLAAVRAEIRVSISAFDTDAQMSHRLKTINAYRRAGGAAVPLAMTALFRRPELNRKQDWFVRLLVDQDLPAAENSLRFDPTSPVMELLDRPQYREVASSHDLWCGRLYPEVLRVPTTTSLPPEYEGLQSNRLSGNDPEFLKSLFCDPVHTHQEVLTSPPLDKPRQCGVASQPAAPAVEFQTGELISIASSAGRA
jgi:hypothetical protein